MSDLYTLHTAPTSNDLFASTNTNLIVVSDLGQTSHSLQTIQHIQQQQVNIPIHAMLLPGDLSYADCDQSRWDSWADLTQDVSATIPLMVAPGNHDVEIQYHPPMCDDFNDLTAITVQGKVLFDVNPNNSDLETILIDKDSNPIGVDGVYVKVGGKRVNNNNGEVQTDVNGNFTMSIPIGNQCITFEKNGYTFSYTSDLDNENNDKYCTDYNFNSEQTLPDFSCNTYKNLRGRVSGGFEYNNQMLDSIPIGFSRPANTIGSVNTK